MYLSVTDSIHCAMNSCLACVVTLVLVTMVTCGVCAAQESCADLEFTGIPRGNTVRIKANSYVNVTFHLKTPDCPYSPKRFRVKMTSNQTGFNVDVCTAIFENHTCKVTDASGYCRCMPGAQTSVNLRLKFNQTGRRVYTWMWSDSDRKQAFKKAFVTFDVFNDAVMNDATNDTKSEADDQANVSTVIVVTCIVTSSVFVVLITIVKAVNVYRRRIAGVGCPDTEGGGRPEQETTFDSRPRVQDCLHPSERLEEEYSEIGYNFLPQDPSAPKVDKYESLQEEKIEGPSAYSHLHDDSSLGLGNGGGKNRKTGQGTYSLNGQGMQGRNTETREFSRPPATVSAREQDTGNAPEADIPEDYLEPVQPTTETLSDPSDT